MEEKGFTIVNDTCDHVTYLVPNVKIDKTLRKDLDFLDSLRDLDHPCFYWIESKVAMDMDDESRKECAKTEEEAKDNERAHKNVTSFFKNGKYAIGDCDLGGRKITHTYLIQFYF
jgi:hypothetical protein